MEIEISCKNVVLINENYIPRLDTKNLTCGMQFEILVIKISNGFQFLGRMRKSPMAISGSHRMKCQILVAGAACVDCDIRTLVKSTKKCKTIVHQRLPVRR